MLKKLSLLLMFIILWVPGYAQDEMKSIELTVNDPNPQIIDFPTCRLSVSATDYGNSMTGIMVDIENTNDNPIFLFGHAISEKNLKKQKIQFDKSYIASKELMVCEGLNGENINIAPACHSVLTIDNVDGPRKRIEIPLYLTKTKKKKLLGKEKSFIVERPKIILNVTLIAEDKTDNEFEDIKSRYDELITKIEQNPVCPNRNHPVSRQKQIDEINAKIMDLKDEISDIKSEHRWKERDDAYKPYKEVLMSLDNIEIKEATCGQCQRDNKPAQRHTHSCNFCSKSPSDILKDLERVYIKLDSRKIKKSEAIKAIESAHKAWSGGCANLKRKMADDSVIRNKVEKYYNSIVNY